MDKKLKAISIEHASNDNEVKITLNASLEIVNISGDFTKMDMSNSEQLEDVLLVTVNEAIQKAQAAQAAESQKMLSDMMPVDLAILVNYLDSLPFIHLK